MKLLDCRVPYVVALFLLTSNSNAEPAVDAGAALRDMDRRLPPPAAQRSPDSLQLDTPAQRLGGNVRVDVRIFNIIGNSQLATEECQSIVKPWLGSQRTFRDLSDAASALATAYRARGLLAAIQFPPQDVTDGIVTIQIVESRFGQVHLDVPVSSADALVTLAQSSLQQEQVRGQPLQVQVLERAPRLLTEIPGLVT
jgi:hemolysin activation/secretion protein